MSINSQISKRNAKKRSQALKRSQGFPTHKPRPIPPESRAVYRQIARDWKLITPKTKYNNSSNNILQPPSSQKLRERIEGVWEGGKLVKRGDIQYEMQRWGRGFDILYPYNPSAIGKIRTREIHAKRRSVCKGKYRDEIFEEWKRIQENRRRRRRRNGNNEKAMARAMLKAVG
jgi:hypothetical protein